MKVIIVGGGRVGMELATLLLAGGQDIYLLEEEAYIGNHLEEEFPKKRRIQGNPSDPKVLEQAGISNTQVLAAVSDTDEKNLVVSTLAKMEFGVDKVIARVNNPQNGWLYTKEMGVDVVINQADIISHLILQEMDLTNMLTLMKLNRGEYSIVQINVNPSAKAIHEKIKDLDIPPKAVLISVTKNGVVEIPKGETEIMEGDEILALTDEKSQKKLSEIFG